MHIPEVSFTGAVALLVVATCLPACFAPPDRAYFAPDGSEFGDSIASHRVERPDAHVLARCQGAYVNEVDGRDVLTVHVQLVVMRPRSGELRLTREDLAADVTDDADVPHVALSLTEAWSGRQPVSGDLVVPSWARRPFDLFFDTAPDAEGALPEEILLRWIGRAGGERVVGQVLFRRIPPTDSRAPSEEPIGDTSFGLRNGYYLPGRMHMRERGLRESAEERMHYVFHDPGGWGW
jgi:hypothetical protein